MYDYLMKLIVIGDTGKYLLTLGVGKSCTVQQLIE